MAVLSLPLRRVKNCKRIETVCGIRGKTEKQFKTNPFGKNQTHAHIWLGEEDPSTHSHTPDNTTKTTKMFLSFVYE